MRDKNKLTHNLIALLSENGSIAFKKARSTWWHNLRNNGGMRLTDVGYDTFCNELDLEKYRFDIGLDTIYDKRFILALDRRLQSPYYILVERKSSVGLMLFGGKEAVMAHLYGDVKKFIDNYTS